MRVKVNTSFSYKKQQCPAGMVPLDFFKYLNLAKVAQRHVTNPMPDKEILIIEFCGSVTSQNLLLG